MPCDLVQTAEVSFERCDQDVLLQTLVELGYTNVSRSGSTINFRDEEQNACTIAYGRLSVRNGTDEQATAMASRIRTKVNDNITRAAAKKAGWRVKTGPDGLVKQLVKRRR